MNLSVLPKDLPVPKDDGKCDHLEGSLIPSISLPNQDGNMLKINRTDTFRLIIYCYPMTGNPTKPLPKDWNLIPGARGCTPQTCSFRDNYESFTKLNAVPIGISTQTTSEIKEMTIRLNVPYDVLSDYKLTLSNKIKLPTFKIEKKTYIKRVTMIVEKSIIRKCFYPIFPPDLHFKEVIKWLEKNQ